MYSPEVHYLVRKEMYKDLQRDVARHQLIRAVTLRQPNNEDRLRKIAGSIGAQMVKLGLKLQHYDQGQHPTLTPQG